MSKPLYVYGDTVVVKEGFHKGLVGIVIDKRADHDRVFKHSVSRPQDYLVIFNNFSYVHKKWYSDTEIKAFK